MRTGTGARAAGAAQGGHRRGPRIGPVNKRGKSTRGCGYSARKRTGPRTHRTTWAVLTARRAGRVPGPNGPRTGLPFLDCPDRHTHRWGRTADRSGAGQGRWARGLRGAQHGGRDHPSQMRYRPRSGSLQNGRPACPVTFPPAKEWEKCRRTQSAARGARRAWAAAASSPGRQLCSRRPPRAPAGLGAVPSRLLASAAAGPGTAGPPALCRGGRGALAGLGRPPAPWAPGCAGQACPLSARLRLFNKD